MASLIRSAQIKKQKTSSSSNGEGTAVDKESYSATTKNRPIGIKNNKQVSNTTNNIQVSNNTLNYDNYVDKTLFEKEKARADSAEKSLQELINKMESEHKSETEKGYLEGYNAGKKEGQSSYNEVIDRLNFLAEQIKNTTDSYLINKEQEIIEIVYASTAKIIGKEVLSLAGIQNIVKEATNAVNQNNILSVRVSPEDYQLLIEHWGSDIDDDNNLPRLTKDERITLGGCIVETRNGSLDARLETQFNLLKELLLHARDNYLHENGL